MAANYVVINGLRLDVTGFATVDDLTPLHQRARNRGRNFVAQGVAGSTFRPKVRDELPLLLRVVIFGENTSAGVVHANRRAGFEANYDEIYAATVAASASALVPLTLNLEDGSARTASVECLSFEVERYGNTHDVWVGPLEVVIPAGQLT